MTAASRTPLWSLSSEPQDLAFRNAAGAITFRATRWMDSLRAPYYELHPCNRAGAIASRTRIIGGRDS
jgi:hypothetical protein